MAANYLELISEFYPDADVICSGSAFDYNNLTFNTTAISQAELDTVYLVKIKTNKILEFSEYARADITAGFISSALGYPHLYDSEPEDQLNLIGAVTSSTDVMYSSWPSSNGYQYVDLGGLVAGSDPTGLPNDNTQHLAEVKFNGTSTYLSVAGQDAQTYDNLVTQMNADADFTANGIATFEAGKIKIVSKTYNSMSTVQIIDSTLFSSLADYVSIETAVPGTDPKDTPKQYKNHTHAQLLTVLNDGKTIKLTALQKFAVKKAQIEAATTEAEIDAITWS